MASFTVTKLIRETHEFKIDPSSSKGRSPGQTLDDLLIDAAKAGHEVDTVTLDITPDEWATVALEHQPSEPMAEYHDPYAVGAMPAKAAKKALGH